MYFERHELYSDALRREIQVKRWSKSKKEALIAGDMEKLKNLSKSRETLPET